MKNKLKQIKSAFRVPFHGKPETGKTLTARSLGKTTRRIVFRLDHSMVVSKYIGETEKNLTMIGDATTYKNGILYFDEADSLFGKRTEIHDARDKFGNLKGIRKGFRKTYRLS